MSHSVVGKICRWRRIKKSDLEMGSAEDEKIIAKKVHIEPKEEVMFMILSICHTVLIVRL